MKKYLILIVLMLFGINFVFGASASLVEFTYDFNSTSQTISSKYHPPILLRIKTPSEQTNCYWSILNNSVYDNGNPFSSDYTVDHEQIFKETDLIEGVNRYYIQCGNSSNPVMAVSFNVKKEISANIQISESAPLKAGIYVVTLTTLRPILGVPTLEYSLDGKVYDPLPLESSGDNWKTKLVIERNAGEVIGSFKFKATDLDGTVGTRINEGNTFLVDTINPGIIENLDATGNLGEIELSWYLGENVEKYEIYRSKNPGVDYTDYYDSSDDETFLDNHVENGKTYYYKIVAIDEAGNKGSFSREISATALISSNTNQTGLNQKLLGKVDNVLVELSLLKSDIEGIQTSISNKDETEKMLFENLELNKDLSSGLSEISSLEKDIERYKLQDLSEIELNQKINQAKLKMDIIKKKIPESLTVIGKDILERGISDSDIELMILEYGQESLTESQQKKTISLTKSLLKNNPIKISSSAYVVSVTYLDGTSNKKSLIIDTISSELERSSDIRILVSIPTEIAEKSSEVDFLTGSPEVLKDNLLVSFDSDIKKIVYKLDKEIDLKNIENIKILPLSIDTSESNSGFVTGFVTFQDVELDNSQIGIILGGIVVLLLLFYFVITRKNKYSEELIKMIELIKEGRKYQKEDEKEKLKEVYEEIKKNYSKISKKEKRKVYKKIKKFHEK